MKRTSLWDIRLRVAIMVMTINASWNRMVDVLAGSALLDSDVEEIKARTPHGR